MSIDSSVLWVMLMMNEDEESSAERCGGCDAGVLWYMCDVKSDRPSAHRPREQMGTHKELIFIWKHRECETDWFVLTSASLIKAWFLICWNCWGMLDTWERWFNLFTVCEALVRTQKQIFTFNHHNLILYVLCSFHVRVINQQRCDSFDFHK